MQIRLEVDLVAVDHRLSYLVRRHERGESADLTLTSTLTLTLPVPTADQNVPELGRPHLGPLLGRLPAHG